MYGLSACRYSRFPAHQHLLVALSVVQFRLGKKGGRFGVKRLQVVLQEVGEFGGSARRKQVLLGQSGFQDFEQQPNPLAHIRLTHTEELSMHVLNRILLEVGQDEQQAIGRAGQRAVGVRDRALAFAEIAIECGAVEIALHGQREVRQKVGECGVVKTGKGA